MNGEPHAHTASELGELLLSIGECYMRHHVSIAEYYAIREDMRNRPSPYIAADGVPVADDAAEDAVVGGEVMS